MRHRLALIALIAIVALTRVAMMHRVFSPTYDEPLHTICGYEYLAEHRYATDLEHPPIARAVLALPFVQPFPGAPAPSPDFSRGIWWERGNALFDENGHYLRGVAKARRGNLLFLLLGILGVAGWAYGRFGPAAALIAAAFFSALPPVLAHAGLATTDMSGTAALALALWALDRWLAMPSWKATAMLALALALGMLCKFSFAFFFTAGVVVSCGLRVAGARQPTTRNSQLATRALAICAAVALLIWSAYFFSFGTLNSAHPTAPLTAQQLFGSPKFFDSVRVPAPLFILGLMQVKVDDTIGRTTYLLGHLSQHGWWYYFPVVLALKTPIPFLLFVFAGVAAVIRDRRNGAVALVAAAILGICMTSHINAGVRHILPIYVPLSLLAAAGAPMLWRYSRVVVLALAVWFAADGFLAHPDYLPWMNAFDGGHPERMLSDSNLDWGQDLLRLRQECRRRDVRELGALLFTRADVVRLGFPPVHRIESHQPSTGWIAISETQIAMWQGVDATAFNWLLPRPYTRVGASIRLYHVP